MKLILLFFALAQTAFDVVYAQDDINSVTDNASPTQRLGFLNYTALFGKSYTNQDDFEMRLQNWIQTDNLIKNSQTPEIVLVHNKFSDWTSDEKQQILNQKLSSQPPFTFENYPDSYSLTVPTKGVPSDTIIVCQPGYRSSGSTCFKCPKGCKTCTNDVACTSCMSDRFNFDSEMQTCTCFTGTYNSTMNDCNIFGKGYYLSDGANSSCDVQNCDNCKVSGTCNNCTANFTNENGQCNCVGGSINSNGSCIKCNSYQFFNNDQCNDCPKNCTTCQSPTGQCTSCGNPTYNLSDGVCSCPSDDYFIDNKTGNCVKFIYCGQGKYNDGWNGCKNCSDFCTSCNFQTGYCNLCNETTMEKMNTTTNWHVAPQFLNVQLGQCRCPPKTYRKNGQCLPLTVQCGDGEYNDGNNTCLKCQNNCTKCTDFIGFCTECNDDTFNSTALVKDGKCVCNDGNKLGNTGSCENSINCGVGKFNDGHNNCLNCNSNCTSCDDWTGRCNQCNPNFTLNSSLSNDQQCQCNNLTQYFIAANNTCADLIDCGVSKFNLGNNTCKKCNSDYCEFCQNFTGVCLTCNSTFTYNAQNDTCYCEYPKQVFDQAAEKCITLSKCQTGQYNLGLTSNNCSACAANCSSCMDWNGTCTSCLSTFTMNATGNCTCKTGQFLNTSNQCQECGANCTTCADSNGTCTQCIGPSFQNFGTFCGCPAGWIYQTTRKQCEPKVNCSDGQYNDDQNNCLLCDPRANTCTSPTTASKCLPTFTLQNGICNCTTTQFQSGLQCFNIIKCGAGFYNRGDNVCVACKGNCTYCTSATTCTGCSNNLALNWPVAGNCACPQYTYQWNEDQFCYGCWAGYGCGVCREPDGFCTTCKAFWTWYNWYCYCWAPSYASGSECQPCPRGCSECANPSTCYGCKPTYTLHYPTSYQCNCLSNQFVNAAGDCQNCGNYTTTCAATSGLATACQSSFSLSNGQCICPEGNWITWSNQQNATICQALITCPDGQYNRGDQVCVACPAVSNCKTCKIISGLLQCTSCNTNYTMTKAAGTYGSCACLANQYVTSQNTCRNCSANMTTCAATTGLATGCLATFTNTAGVCACLSNQFLSTNNTCVNCSTLCTTCSNSTACSSCIATYTLFPTNRTCGCDRTKTYLSTVNNTCVTIFPPPTGQFNNGQNIMTPCGTNCSTCTAAGVGFCTACMPTFTLNNGSCSCLSQTQFWDLKTNRCVNITTCAAGTVNNGFNVCNKCAANCTSCVGTTTNCSSCLSNFTLNYPVPGSCACNKGFYLTSKGSCAPVSQNCSRAADGTGVCTNCLPSFNLNATTSQCFCNSTQWYNLTNTTNPNCGTCPLACTNCTNASFCGGCKAGYIYNKISGTCTCNSGTFDNQGLGCAVFTACPDGQSNIGNNQCKNCDVGCAVCKNYTGECIKCQDGYRLLSGSCSQWRLLAESTNCGEGCAECNNAGNCTKCKLGFIQNQLNASTCLNCSQYPVGPVEKASICLQNPYNADRIVPEFTESDINVDWRKWSVIRPVKDQGSCGSDYAFSSTAAAESTFAIKTGLLYDLSEQYLLDCDSFSQGCSGGWQTTAGFLLATSGAILEADYPYVGTKQNCQKNAVDKVFYLKFPGSMPILPSKNSFKAALRKSPINVSFKIFSDLFFQYGSGIIPARICQEGEINHAMLALGYGIENGVEYALVQNQWGIDWGDSGIFRIELTEDETGPCGLYQQNQVLLV